MIIDKQLSCRWILTILISVAAFVGVWIVDKSCEFVRITGHTKEDNSEQQEEVFSVTRGTQRGMLQPGDECTPWGQYEELEQLDSKMTMTRVSAALSIVFGAIVISYLLVTAIQLSSLSSANFQCMKCCHYPRVITSVLAICISIFQALTHLMISSDLCEGSIDYSIVDDEDKTFVYDDCDRSTPAYNSTFVTIFLWLLVAYLIATLPASNKDLRAEEDGIEDEENTGAPANTTREERNTNNDGYSKEVPSKIKPKREDSDEGAEMEYSFSEKENEYLTDHNPPIRGG